MSNPRWSCGIYREMNHPPVTVINCNSQEQALLVGEILTAIEEGKDCSFRVWPNAGKTERFAQVILAETILDQLRELQEAQ